VTRTATIETGTETFDTLLRVLGGEAGDRPDEGHAEDGRAGDAPSAAAARVGTASFARIADMWWSTVFGEMRLTFI